MTREKVIDELWTALEPLIPVPVTGGRGRRHLVSNRAALSGIPYVLHIGISWENLPHELGFCSGMTYWRRLKDWQAAGAWERIHLFGSNAESTTSIRLYSPWLRPSFQVR